ncbi:MAG: restriction endonuclease subunit S [Mediterranea sp.]|nr:restriction endonuclease subunit S [Mediterranea sp.]
MEKRGLVPRLRFPGFEGEWTRAKLHNIGEPSMCKRVLKEETYSESLGNIPFYKIGTFGGSADAYITTSLYETYKNKYSYPHKGDILISAAGTIGRLVIYDGSPAYFQDSNIVWINNDESIVLNTFLYYAYQMMQWQTSDGGIVMRLYNTDLINMAISFPSLEEQQKIASCLSSIDTLISAHTQKLDALKAYKKGLMQQLFPTEGEKVPRLRFEGFEGEWEEKTLDNLCYDISSGRNSIRKSDGQYKVYGSTGIIGYCDKYIYDTPMILVARVGANAGKINKAFGQYDVSDNTLMVENKAGYNFDFAYYQLTTIDLNKLVSGSGQPLLTAGQLKRLIILLPTSKQEQQKIASCLSSIDTLIFAQSQKLEDLKSHKKGLMQQLFPQTNE